MSDTNVYFNIAENDNLGTPSTAPLAQLKTNRGLIKFILLSLVTFGIYAIICYSNISTDINIIASRYDGKKTKHYCLMSFILAPITFGIYVFVWYHGLSNRIGAELKEEELIIASALQIFGFGIFSVHLSLLDLSSMFTNYLMQ